MDWSASEEAMSEKIETRRLLLFLLLTPLFLAVLMFWPAGTWEWERGWAFIAVFSVTSVVASLYMRRANPDLLAARINRHQGTEPWDRVLVSLLIACWLAVLPIGALDDGRFHWLPLSWWVCILGDVLYVIGTGIMTWAQSVNKFFEPTVRLQEDRGQRVIDVGPYALVRHPGYVGGIVLSAGMALALGSLWALIPVGLMALVLVVRTKWEDETLQAKLPGYREYAGRVRYRLVPGLW